MGKPHPLERFRSAKHNIQQQPDLMYKVGPLLKIGLSFDGGILIMGPCHFCCFCLSEYAISNAHRKDLGTIPASFTRPNIVSFGKVN